MYWIGLVIVGGLAATGWWLWRRRAERRKLAAARQLTVLKVLVPKEPDADEAESGTKRDFREVMSVAEQFLASFASLHESSPSRWLDGQETLSLELVVKDNLMSFFVVVPKHLRELVERQLHSYYPDAQVEPSQEFRMFQESLYPAGFTLSLAKGYQLPIRTYKQLESDPLNAVTNSFSKLPEGTKAGLQILIQPTSGRWREKTSHAASQIAQGKGTGKGHWLSSLLGSLVDALRPSSQAGDQKRPEELVRLTPIQEEMMKSIREKGSKVGFATRVRVVVASPRSAAESKASLENIASAFGQYTSPELNRFKVKPAKDVRQFVADYIVRAFGVGKSPILTTEELASLYHLPNQFIDTPIIEWLSSRVLPPPANLPAEDPASIIIGKSVYRGEERLIRLREDDRRRHLYAIGKTGVGKTTIFINQIVQDIQAGRGVAYIDPNGDAVEEILGLIPKERAEDVVYFDPADTNRPMGLNLLQWQRPEDRDFLVAEWLEVFYKLFDPNRTGMVGPQFEHWGRNASLSVMSRPEGGTLIDIPTLFTDDAFREDTIRYVTDPVVRAFWEQQMAKTADFHKSEMYNYFISKFGRFMTNDLMRNIIGQTESAFNFRQIMDTGKIFLVNLSKGKIGETNSYLLGMIIVAKLQVAAFQRADTPEKDRRDFYLYVDEFQNFTTDTFKTILAEARKYRLNLSITNQYIAQLPEEIRDAVIGNVGTLVTFRIGATDAEFMAKEYPNVTEHDMVNLPFANTYVKLLVGGTPTKPFSMRTIKTEVPYHKELAQAISQLSRLKYGKDKRIVEAEIAARTRGSGPRSRIPNFPPTAEGGGV